ncbi:hypothetical protein, partial [Chroococcidiopsis cubana]
VFRYPSSWLASSTSYYFLSRRTHVAQSAATVNLQSGLSSSKSLLCLSYKRLRFFFLSLRLFVAEKIFFGCS